MLKDCTCVGNCSQHCNNIDIDMVDANVPTNSSDQTEENGNDATTSVDNDSILNAANNNYYKMYATCRNYVLFCFVFDNTPEAKRIRVNNANVDVMSAGIRPLNLMYSATMVSFAWT